MFKTLDEVKNRWQVRYEASSIEDDLLTSPGYSIQAITAVEEKIGLKFHPSMRGVLQALNLDQVGFRNIRFGAGRSYLAALQRMNDGSGEVPKAVDRGGLVWIGSSSNHFFLLKNESGEIFVAEYYQPDGFRAPLEQIASDFQELILIVATIADYQWSDFKDKADAVQASQAFFAENPVLQGKNFWTQVIWGAA